MNVRHPIERVVAVVIAIAMLGLAAGPAAAADRTVLVKDIRAGSRGSNPAEMTKAGSLVYFVASSRRHGRELWKTRGSSASTRLVKDLRKGRVSSRPEELVAAGPMLFFLANDGQVWRTKGTSATTVRLKAPRWWGRKGTAVLGGKLYWAASNGLWVSGGSPANTRRLHPVKADSDSGMHRVGDRIYFAGRTSSTGTELWVTDGTEAGTRMVTEIVPGPGSAFGGCNEWAHIGSTVLFTASDQDGLCGWQLWRSDGTGAGTRKLRDFTNAIVPTQLTRMGSAVYFRAFRDWDGTELWRTDGTGAGTDIVRDINPGGGYSEPEHLVASRGTLFFVADDGPHGRELWRSDGSSPGTRLVRDIATGGRDAYIDLITKTAKGWVFFGAAKAGEGHEPFRSKGTSATTRRTKDVRKGVKGGMRVYCGDCSVALGKHVYFCGNDGRKGWELWRWTR